MRSQDSGIDSVANGVVRWDMVAMGGSQAKAEIKEVKPKQKPKSKIKCPVRAERRTRNGEGSKRY